MEFLNEILEHVFIDKLNVNCKRVGNHCLGVLFFLDHGEKLRCLIIRKA